MKWSKDAEAESSKLETFAVPGHSHCRYKCREISGTQMSLLPRTLQRLMLCTISDVDVKLKLS